MGLWDMNPVKGTVRHYLGLLSPSLYPILHWMDGVMSSFGTGNCLLSPLHRAVYKSTSELRTLLCNSGSQCVRYRVVQLYIDNF